jgi:two-component system, NtrC family, sensor kinase
LTRRFPGPQTRSLRSRLHRPRTPSCLTAAQLKKYQRALDDAKGRLRLLSAHTRGIVFELDSDVRFVRVWASDPQLLAAPESEALGRTILEVLGPEIGQKHHDAAKVTVETGNSVSYEYELDVPSGHRYFSCQSVAVPADSRKGNHAVFWIRDVTDQVQLQQKLIRTERLAMVGALAAGVAHEINNPLAYMMLNAEQLGRIFDHFEKDQPLNDRLDSVRTCIRMIHDGAGHVRNIVNELLQLAKPDDPTEPVNISQAFNLALDMTRPILTDDVRICIDCDDVSPVMANHGRLVQVFSNLLTNAAEAMPDTGDGKQHQVSISAQHLGPDAVLVTFSDTGNGIAKSARNQIFDPFFTTKSRGTGLGLTICQRIINGFNGEIRYEPAHPRGTVFKILLEAAISKPQPTHLHPTHNEHPA